MYDHRPDGLPLLADILEEKRRLARQPERIKTAVLEIEHASLALNALTHFGRTVKVGGRTRRIAELDGGRVEAIATAPGLISVTVYAGNEARRSFTLKRTDHA
ncbi:MAG: hypothetical protein ACXIVO_07825 [Glycocaulis sp.]